LATPDTDGRGVFETKTVVSEDERSVPAPTAPDDTVADVVADAEGPSFAAGDEVTTGLEVAGGTQTDVVTVVGWSLSVQVAVVWVCTQPAGAMRSVASGALPACHDSGS